MGKVKREGMILSKMMPSSEEVGHGHGEQVLCKVLAHNLYVLNQEECELGIEAMFSNREEKVLPLSA